MKTTLLFSCLVASLHLHVPVNTIWRAAPQAPVPCTMSNGQTRPYPCEFKIQAMYLLGKNNEVVGTLTPANTSVKLPRSKAVQVIKSSSGESFIYTVSLDIRRINTASFPPKPSHIPGLKVGFYEVGTSTVTSPISPGEVKPVKRVDIAQALPKPGVRPTRISFTLQLNYTTGAGATIVAPVQYVQVKNPITFTKFPASVNQYRDRAEAWLAFNTSVDMTK